MGLGNRNARQHETIAAQKGEKSAALDETVALVDARLELNRKKA